MENLNSDAALFARKIKNLHERKSCLQKRVSRNDFVRRNANVWTGFRRFLSIFFIHLGTSDM